MIRFCERNLSLGYMGHWFSFTHGFSLVVDFSLVCRCRTRSVDVSEDNVCRLSNSVTRSRSSTLEIPSCCSHSLFVVIVSHRELIAPEVVRACRYWVYMYEGSTHLRWLVVQVLFVHGGILPFATNSAGACLLQVVVLCMCSACASACACHVQVQVQVQVQVLCMCSFM